MREFFLFTASYVVHVHMCLMLLRITSMTVTMKIVVVEGRISLQQIVI